MSKFLVTLSCEEEEEEEERLPVLLEVGGSELGRMGWAPDDEDAR